MMGMGQQMPMRRPPTGPSQMTAGRPNPMAGFRGGGGQQMGPFNPAWRQGYGGGRSLGSGEPAIGQLQGVAPNSQLPQMAQAVQGQMGGYGPQAMQTDQMGQGMSQGFAGGPQGIGPGPAMQGFMGGIGGQFGGQGGGGSPMGPQYIQNLANQMGGGMMPSDIGSEGGPSGARWAAAQGPGRRRFPGALQRGIMQGMAPQAPQAMPPAPYGGQPFRMW